MKMAYYNMLTISSVFDHKPSPIHYPRYKGHFLITNHHNVLLLLGCLVFLLIDISRSFVLQVIMPYSTLQVC